MSFREVLVSAALRDPARGPTKMTQALASSQLGRSGLSNIDTETGFNPRLRLDVSSGRVQLRGLAESINKLGTTSPEPQGMRLAAANGVHAGGEGAPALFAKAVALMQGRHTQEMHERHCAFLRAICAECSAGFFMHQLGDIDLLLGAAARHLRAGVAIDGYTGAVCELLRTLALPLRKRRCTDDQTCATGCAALIRTASSLLRLSIAPISLAAAEMLLALATPADVRAGRAPLRPSLAVARALTLVEQSGAVQNLVALLGADARSDAGFATMRALRAFSRHPPIATHILAADELPALVALLKLPLNEPVLPMAVEVCWNLLEARGPEAAATLGTPAFLEPVADLFARAMRATRDVDKEIRNELLVIATRVAQNLPADARGPLLASPMLGGVLGILSAEAGCAEHAQPPSVDWEMLQLACAFAQVITASAPLAPAALAALDEAQLVPTLVSFLAPDARAHWSRSRLVELRRLALGLLANLALALPSIEQLHPALAPVSGYLGRERGAELADAAVRTLSSVLQRALDGDAPQATQLLLGDLGAVELMVERLSAPVRGLGGFDGAFSSTTSAVLRPLGLSSAALQDSLLCLSLLCADCDANGAKFGAHGGVSVLAPMLSPRVETRLLLAAVDCLWSCVASSHSNVERLVERDGVLQLLSCVERADFAPRAHVLSCLADILAHPAAAEQAREYRGGAGVSAIQLLLSLWSEEEARVGGAAGDGSLSSTQRPLSVPRDAELAALNASLRLGPGAPREPDAASTRSSAGGSAGSRSPSRRRSLDVALSSPARDAGWRSGGSSPSLGGTSSALEASVRAGGYDDSDDDADADAELAALHDGSIAAGLKLTSLTALQIGGRFEGLGGSPEAAAFENHDLRAKLYALLLALGFDSPTPLAPAELTTLETARQYSALVDAEAWRDVHDELDASAKTRPVTADAAKIQRTLDRLQAVAEDVLTRQHTLLGTAAEAGAEADEAMLTRVRVLRDGPNPAQQSARSSPGSDAPAEPKKGKSIFRARLEAKARAGEMVANSLVSYDGPVPTPAEFADAAVEAIGEGRAALADAAEGEGDAARAPSPPITYRDAPEALALVARHAGIDASRIEPFLQERGAHANTSLRVQVHVDEDPRNTGVSVSQIEPDDPMGADQLRELCVDFQR